MNEGKRDYEEENLSGCIGLTLCLGVTGCSAESMGLGKMSKLNESSKFISIEGETDLYYYATTNIVYIAFNYCVGNIGYGYMSPYYSENGRLCTYDVDTKQIVEVEE